jgi:hypothetical protein
VDTRHASNVSHSPSVKAPAPVEAHVSTSDIWITSNGRSDRVIWARPSSCTSVTFGCVAMFVNDRWLPVSRSTMMRLTSTPNRPAAAGSREDVASPSHADDHDVAASHVWAPRDVVTTERTGSPFHW